MKRGIISTIVIIIVALILLKIFFNFDIVKFIQKPEVQEILSKIWQIIKTGFGLLWEWVKIGWRALGGFLNKIGV